MPPQRLDLHHHALQILAGVVRSGFADADHIAALSEQEGDWTITRIFSGSFTCMQAQYGLKYL